MSLGENQNRNKCVLLINRKMYFDIIFILQGSNRKYSLSSKTGTLLPEFPDADNLILPNENQREKVRSKSLKLHHQAYIILTCPRDVDHLTSHFYIVQLGFTGVYIFLIFARKHKPRLCVPARTALMRRF